MSDLEHDAYVYPGQRIARNGHVLGHGQGMTLRDWFAGQALAGILSGGFADTIPHDDIGGGADAAHYAFQYADAMIAALKTGGRVMQRRVEYFETDGRRYYRAHIWTAKGYSSKTFLTPTEAALWLPKEDEPHD